MSVIRSNFGLIVKLFIRSFVCFVCSLTNRQALPTLGSKCSVKDLVPCSSTWLTAVSVDQGHVIKWLSCHSELSSCTLVLQCRRRAAGTLEDHGVPALACIDPPAEIFLIIGWLTNLNGWLAS